MHVILNAGNPGERAEGATELGGTAHRSPAAPAADQGKGFPLGVSNLDSGFSLNSIRIWHRPCQGI